jgi:hypothetical protein
MGKSWEIDAEGAAVSWPHVSPHCPELHTYSHTQQSTNAWNFSLSLALIPGQPASVIKLNPMSVAAQAIGRMRDLAAVDLIICVCCRSHCLPENQRNSAPIVVCLFTLAWHVIGWKFMSREGRAALVAGFKKRHGIPLDQPHKVDSILKK